MSSLKEQLDSGPRVSTREADTTVRIREGETLVIGGLIQQTDNTSVDKIPVLGNLPLIGYLFSRTNKVVEQTELAVFITPRILYSKEEQKALGLKQRDVENSYLLIDKMANNAIVERIYAMARDLDKGVGIESIRKDKSIQKMQALSQYEIIYKQFPDSERAAEAKYLSGVIQWKTMRDYKSAKNTFSTLITDFPKSEWADTARQDFEEMTLEMQEERMETERVSDDWKKK